MNHLQTLFNILLTIAITSLPTLGEEAKGNIFRIDVIDSVNSELPKILNTPPERNGLKVFWWNIRNGGELAKARFEEAKKLNLPGAVNELDLNITSLVNSPGAPEVLLLAEYDSQTLSSTTERLLSILYPFQEYQVYNSYRSDRGIQVYSKYPFNTASSLLDWSPLYQSNEKQLAFKRKWRKSIDPKIDESYERLFSEIKISKNGEQWILCPVHLMNNWLSISEKIGKKKAGLVLVFGDDNPHYYQVQRLMDEKIAPIISRLEKPHLILVGDFNLPNQVYDMVPRSFGRILSSLNVSRQMNFTFPAVSSDMTGTKRLTIDHAFHSAELITRDIARLPLTGSDHYPIEFQIYQ